MARIEVRTHRRAVRPGEVDAALAAINRDAGVWLGCDVEVPGLYRREAAIALDPLLMVCLDGRRLRLVLCGSDGGALAQRVLPEWVAVDGRLEVETAPGEALTTLRRLLAAFADPPPEFGLYGLLAFDYWRLQDAAGLPDDERRRLVLMLPRRVLAGVTDRWEEVSFELPALVAADSATRPGDAVGDGVRVDWESLPHARLDSRADDHPPGGHAAVVARGVERMRRGELASLVLSQTFRRAVGEVDAAAAFARLRRDNPYPAMFFVHTGGGERVFGASPDVQVRADAQWVETAPVCGTFRRGTDALDDHAQGRDLLNSAVDEASLAVCADSDRNDKARVCVPGTLEHLARRRLHFFTTIIHTIDHARGRRRPDVDAFDLVLAHATPATVTGMPKEAARAAIDALEPCWRGWYAGAAVRLGADGGCLALTMLRFARLVDGWAEVRTGGSLLADSDPVREEQETQLKAETMFRVLAGASPRPTRDALQVAAPRRVAFVDAGDPLAALAREALFQAGARFDDHDDDAAGRRGDALSGADQHALCVLGDAPDAATAGRLAAWRIGAPALAINRTGLAVLEAAGAVPQPLDPPQFGRTLQCVARPDGALAALGTFEVGVYATHRLPAAALPAGWTALVVGADGRVVAALHEARRSAVLLCRPDSVLSQRHGAGIRLLSGLFDLLDPRSPTEKEPSR